jgi:hypothetical protein
VKIYYNEKSLMNSGLISRTSVDRRVSGCSYDASSLLKTKKTNKVKILFEL